MEKLLSLRDAMAYLHVCKSTLHRWDKEGKLIPLKTSGGHRRYKLSELQRFSGDIAEDEKPSVSDETRVATYARCSTSDQQRHGDIDRQSQRLTEHAVAKHYKIEHIIKDMGSGLNDRRRGFVKLCNLVMERKVDKVLIEHKDRLTRFGYDLIERFFRSYGVEIELTDDKEHTEQEELVNDMMMLLASFSGRLYSARARENNKRKKDKTE